MPGRTEPLAEEDLPPDPMELFERWFADAEREVRLPESVALATAGAASRPSVRMVLARVRDQRGFVFFTDYRSSKSRQLEQNPRAAMAFHWDTLGRQVRIEGEVSRAAPEESDSYFASRPRGSQIAAHASVQSEPIASRAVLEERYAQLSERFEGRPVPRPDWWGGFRLLPESFEFWQERPDRLHDRILYTRDTEGWRTDRLQP